MICLQRRNWPLAAGLVICGAWLLVAVLYPLFVAYPQPTGDITEITRTEQGLRIRTAPFAPSTRHPLGTDERARDLLARLLFGARLTLAATLAVALGRLAGAVPLGLWAATHPQRRWLIDQLTSMSRAIPPVILIMIVTLPLAWYHELPALPSAAALVAIMLVLGLPRVATGVAAHTEEVLARPFIVGAVAAGASRRRVVWRHWPSCGTPWAGWGGRCAGGCCPSLQRGRSPPPEAVGRDRQRLRRT